MLEKGGLFSILVQNSPKVPQKSASFPKSCQKLLSNKKVAKKLPSRIWKGLAPLENNVYCISSRIFENIPQNGPEYSHRNLAIARFLVTAVRKNIAGLLSWLVSLSSSVPELIRHGLGRSLHVNPQRGRVLQKRSTVRQSCSGRVSLFQAPRWWWKVVQ